MIRHSMDVPEYPIKAIPPQNPAMGKKEGERWQRKEGWSMKRGSKPNNPRHYTVRANSSHDSHLVNQSSATVLHLIDRYFLSKANTNILRIIWVIT